MALSDILATRRETACKFGADVGLNPTAPELAAIVREIADEGFDVVFEASGSRAALRQAFDLVRPGGTTVQNGALVPEDIPLPANLLMNREINFIGSMRYGNVFGEAIRLVEAQLRWPWSRSRGECTERAVGNRPRSPAQRSPTQVLRHSSTGAKPPANFILGHTGTARPDFPRSLGLPGGSIESSRNGSPGRLRAERFSSTSRTEVPLPFP